MNRNDSVTQILAAGERYTTPTAIGNEHREFAVSLTGGVPEYVIVHPAKNALHGFCFQNVAKVVARRGGSPVYGWTIWEWKGIALSAEFHCNWRNPTGQLIDVTPKRDGEYRILFVVDPNAVYTGERVVTRFRPLSDHPAVQNHFAVSEQLIGTLVSLSKALR